MDYRNRNRTTWDSLANGSPFARVASDEDLRNPLAAMDSRGWLPARVEGLDVLCLAAGGGWQSILYAAAGARVTVVDLSPAMLELDRREAARRSLDVTCVEAAMEDLPLPAEAFDIVHQPVSTCYTPDLAGVYAEVARVLRPGGLYVSQHKTPTSLQVSCSRAGSRGDAARYALGVELGHLGPLPPSPDRDHREADAAEYLHSYHDLLGGLCRGGFVVEDVVEPDPSLAKAPPGSRGHRGRWVRPYLRIKARRTTPPTARVWTP